MITQLLPIAVHCHQSHAESGTASLICRVMSPAWITAEFHAELAARKQHTGGQRKWYKDMKAANIPTDQWYALSQDRQGWSAVVRVGIKKIQSQQSPESG